MADTAAWWFRIGSKSLMWLLMYPEEVRTNIQVQGYLESAQE